MRRSGLFCFSFSAAATPKLGMGAVDDLARALSGSKDMGQRRRKLIIRNTEGMGGYDILEVMEDSIALTCYSEKVGVREKARGLLRFLGILSYFKDVYEVGLNSLYHPLVEALAANQFTQMVDGDRHGEARQIDALSNSNAALAIELRRLSETNEDAGKRCETYREFCTKVLKNFPNAEISTFTRLGVEKSTVEKVMQLIGGGA